jgi:polar amino acid transport system substrate-binding protein
MTVQQLQGDINGPDDLVGKRVATILGSTSFTYLREHGVRPVEYSQIEDAIKALQDRKVQAVVYDSPVLLYYAAQEGHGQVQVVGPVFRKEDYGIVFPPKSPWRKPVNNALLQLKEDGTYQELLNKWFSNKQAGTE